MISYIDLKSHLLEKEDVTKEFKPNFRNHRDDIGSTLAAFSNDYSWIGGGYLYIGVNNDGIPIGLTEDFDEIQKSIADICRQSIVPSISPFITKLNIDNKEIAEVKILRSISRPHRYKQICYIRVASTTRKATKNEENIIQQNAVLPSYDKQPAARYSSEQIDWNKFDEYINSCKSKDIYETTNDIKEIALNLEFVLKTEERFIPRIGTLLVFGISPSSYFANSKIQAVKYNGIDITSPISSRRIIEGTLPELIRDAINFVENITSKGSIIESDSLTRNDILEYPFLVLREAVANAVVHRDYSIAGREIDLRIFDDRIEIMSPGTLGGGLTVEDLGTGKRYIRNQLIVDTLNEMRYIERAGTGIARILKEMKINGSPNPKFQVDINTFKIIIPSHPFYSSKRITEEGIQEKLRGNFKNAVSYFQKALEINDKNLVALTNWADLENTLGNRENSRLLFKKAIEIDKTNANSWLALAFLEEKLGNVKTAKDLYKDAARNVTNPSIVYRSWAIHEWNQKNYSEADILFDKALKSDPRDYLTLYKRGQMNINSPNNSIKKKGEDDLRKALKLTSDTYIQSDILFLLARAMPYLRYSFQEIKEHYQKSIDLNPGRATILYHFGEFLKKNGFGNEGSEYVSKAKLLGFVPKPLKKR